jgi:hypothetical protein
LWALFDLLHATPAWVILTRVFIEFRIEQGDVRSYAADVLVLKYAQKFYGADEAVVSALALAGVARPDELTPAPGETRLIDTRGAIGSRFVLFVGTPPLHELDYGEVRTFAANGIRAVAESGIEARRIACTLHGPGFGFDEVESALALIAGFNEGLASNLPPRGQQIIIVERDADRVKRLDHALATEVPESVDSQDAGPESATSFRLEEAAQSPSSQGDKSRVFVAMPFAKEFDDLFYFGIHQPVRNVGLVCERVDQLAFTGDVLQTTKERIDRSQLVIGVLTAANANVYLEIGYAWGRGKSTLLVIKEGERPLFDVQGQRHLAYETLYDLSQKLTAEIPLIIEAG